MPSVFQLHVVAGGHPRRRCPWFPKLYTTSRARTRASSGNVRTPRGPALNANCRRGNGSDVLRPTPTYRKPKPAPGRCRGCGTRLRIAAGLRECEVCSGVKARLMEASRSGGTSAHQARVVSKRVGLMEFFANSVTVDVSSAAPEMLRAVVACLDASTEEEPLGREPESDLHTVSEGCDEDQ